MAHLGYFRREFVVRARWLDDTEFAEIVALCSILPGPTSSQVGMTLGFRRAGFIGAFCAWLAFTLPSAILMTVFGLFLRSATQTMGTGSNVALSGALDGLAGVAAAIVLVAVIGLARSLAVTRLARAIAIGALVMALACARASLALSWLPLVAGGIAGGAFGPASALPRETARIRIPRATAIVAAGAFALLLAGLPIVAAGGTALESFATFFRAGALVFGGGHVVLSFLDGAIARGSISARDFFAGYGVAQAVPGPLFTFAAFLGVMESTDVPIQGALVAIVAIFLPSFLLLTAVLPIWNVLRDVPRARAVLDGFGAAVVGLLAAVFITPIGTSLLQQPRSLIIAIAAVPILLRTKFPAWAVVALGAAAGIGLRMALRT